VQCVLLSAIVYLAQYDDSIRVKEIHNALDGILRRRPLRRNNRTRQREPNNQFQCPIPPSYDRLANWFA
jgi:hypothetical protein